MTSEHLKDNRRHNIVTASQAWAAVYERQKLWREKTFRAEPFAGNEMTEYGNLHEPIALAAFEEEMNEICESGNQLVVHPDRPLGASPDGYITVNGERSVVELKSPFTQKIYPEIPERYWFQMQVQMFCTGLQSAWFYVWTPFETHKEKVFYDEEFMDWYLPKVEEFIQFVNDDVEPPRYSRKPKYTKEII